MKQDYIAPTLQVVKFNVEQGFTSTIGPAESKSFEMDHLFDNEAVDKNQASQFSYSDWSW